jgi:NDP-sugar pyrophosphorylase family protein
MLLHLGGRADTFVEEPRLLGSAGALAALKDWISGSAVLVYSADAWHQSDLSELVTTWDGETTHLWVVRDPHRPDFDDVFYVGAAILPWKAVVDLPAEGHLLLDCWPQLVGGGRLSYCHRAEPWIDCGIPQGLYAANMRWSGGKNVIAPSAVVEGCVEASVVLADAVVERGEFLKRSIRHVVGTFGPFEHRPVPST